MNRRNFFKGVGALFMVALVPFKLKSKPLIWKQVLWIDVKQGQRFTANTNFINDRWYQVKYLDYGWVSVFDGKPDKGKCTFDPEKAAWAFHKMKVWTLA